MIKPQIFRQSRKGVASLYAVVFATILFGVIALSFMRIIISESRQSGDDELSQSAYDSALAGVEDAKRAVNKYYACINSGKTDAECGKLFESVENCEQFVSGSSSLKSMLNYSGVEGEIKLQESNSNVSGDTAADQAYTCVTLSKVVEDYRSSLTSDTRVRVVPLGIESSKLANVKKIQFRWFSENNGTKTALDRLYQDKSLKNLSETSKVPVISLTTLFTGEKFKIDDFNNSTSPDYDTMILLPTKEGTAGATNEIGWGDVKKAGDSRENHQPFSITCKQGEFACSVTLKDVDFVGIKNAMLVVSMPYGETITDFAVTLYDSHDNPIDFEGVQVSVDSTGRANQLYRRIETRLDPGDNYFPYPQFAVESGDGGDDAFWKNFWITYNCWTQRSACDNNGKL